MSTTRRTILGGALAAPLMAQFTSTARGATLDDQWGTISDGWVEIRWTPQAQAQLDQFHATVEAIAPATPTEDGTGLRLPVSSATGDPALADLPQAQGSGRLDGGLTVRMPSGEVRVTGLEGMLQGERVSGTFAVNGVDVGVRSVFTCILGEGRLAVEPASPGQPLKIRLTGVPVRLAPEALTVFTSAPDAPELTGDTVLAHATAEGTYTPPRR